MTGRTTDTTLDRLFLDRWSPRAFDGATIPQSDLDTMLDAARWAPSASNYQPWRILYAHRGDAHWDAFFSALVPFNQLWVGNAGVLLYFLSDTLMEKSAEDVAPAYSHSFDTGAAWAQLGLQATMLDYHAHGMIGVDFDKARDVLAVPERYRIEAAAAIGRSGPLDALPERMRKSEVPSGRKPLSEIAYPGPFRDSVPAADRPAAG